MSVDSLETSTLHMKTLKETTEATNGQATSTGNSNNSGEMTNALNVLNNELYNQPESSQSPEKVYDLNTYGLDMSVVEGEVEPIIKPVIQKKSAKNGKKRTFANMVWPMSAEEERILCSNSPVIVPEVIVTRNDTVKSILKKNLIVDTDKKEENLGPSNNSEYNNNNNEQNLVSPKKKVDFHKNFLFVNVFDRIEPDNTDELPKKNQVKTK